MRMTPKMLGISVFAAMLTPGLFAQAAELNLVERSYTREATTTTVNRDYSKVRIPTNQAADLQHNVLKPLKDNADRSQKTIVNRKNLVPVDDSGVSAPENVAQADPPKTCAEQGMVTGGGGACVACGVGTVFNSATNHCDIQCEDGMVQNASKDACMPALCEGTGQPPVNGVCVAAPSCQAGYTLVSGNCVQLCSDGSAPVNGSCSALVGGASNPGGKQIFKDATVYQQKGNPAVDALSKGFSSQILETTTTTTTIQAGQAPAAKIGM